MTIKEARKILSGRLVFGDPVQIKAVRFIERVETCIEEIMSCENYKRHAAKGEMEATDAAAARALRRSVKSCRCVSEVEGDVLEAALTSLADELYGDL